MACHSLNRPRSKPHLIVQQRQVQLAQLLQRVGQVGVRLAVGGATKGPDGSASQLQQQQIQSLCIPAQTSPST